MASLDQDLSQLLSQLYRAPGDEQQWNQFLATFSSITGSEQSLLIHHDAEEHRTTLNCGYCLEPEFGQSYEAYYQHLNPYLSPTSAIVHPQQGTFGLLDEVLPDKAVMKTEFFNDYVVPQGLTVKNAIRLTPLVTDGIFTSIALHRAARDADRCPKHALQLSELLMPHLETALSLHRKIVGLESGLQSVTGLLDNMSFGVALFGRNGRCIVINEAARNVFHQNDGLSFKNGRISTATSSNAESIATMIHHAQQVQSGSGTDAIGICQVYRPSGRRPFEVLVSPVFEDDSVTAVKRANVAVFIFDPESENQSLDMILTRLYQLTKAEVKVLELMLQGISVTQISDRLAISRETVRTHLRHIFQKTDTNRQSELVSVVLKGVAAIRPSKQ